MFEIRRGNENLDSLLKKDFEKVYDPVYKFNCWRKVCILYFFNSILYLFGSFITGVKWAGQKPQVWDEQGYL